MAGKRSASTRAPVASAPRGRPRHNTRSTYATTPNNEAEDDQMVQDQPPPAEEQPQPQSIAAQELQQL